MVRPQTEIHVDGHNPLIKNAMPQMMLKRSGKVLAWLTVLITILVMISALTWNTGLAGSGLGTGVFSYHLSARFRFWHDSPGGDVFSGTINIHGETGSRFMAWGQVSPKYREVKMNWEVFRDGASEGRVVIDLEQLLILHKSGTFPLNTDTLCSLVGIPNGSEPDDTICAGLIDFLQSARLGTLPKPNHHSYSLPEPFAGRMQHSATGFSLRPFELIWIVAWSILGLGICIKSRRPQRARSAQVQ